MAAALSLQEDILALVKKHGDTCLPEDLLARLAEEARLLAVREQIRSLHEADRFGLFSEPSGQEEEPSADGDDAEEDGGAEQQDGSGGAGKDNGQTLVLPDNVQHMLSNMKITRLDKVAALNGFTTIDAEVEFSQGNTTTTSDPTPHGKAAPHPAGEAEAGGGSGSPSPPEKKPPVYLLFRFRREPLPKNTDASASDSDSSDSDSDSGSDGDNDVFITSAAAPRTSSVTVVNLSDEEDDEAEGGKVGSAEAAAGVVGEANGRRKGGDHCTTTPEGGLNGDDGRGGVQAGAGDEGGGLEGRKRASSRGESDTGNGGDKRRKRPKGREEGGEGREEEAQEREGGEGCTEEVCKTGCCGDGSESDDEGLDFEPRTLVSYTISGGMGFERPNVLLQAVVYARGDGPACVMPPPIDLAPHGGEEEVVLASDTSDQEDVFDCNVDGPALAAIGRVLGLHTDPVAPDSDSDEQDQIEGRSSQEYEGHGEGGAKHGGMTLSDLVWWVMLFPFFEKEFDMVEVVASSVFGDDDSDSDDGEGQDGGDSGDSDDSEPGK